MRGRAEILLDLAFLAEFEETFSRVVVAAAGVIF